MTRSLDKISMQNNASFKDYKQLLTNESPLSIIYYPSKQLCTMPNNYMLNYIKKKKAPTSV